MKKPLAKRSQQQSNQPHHEQHRIEMQSHSWQGPLPPPAALSGFDAVVPGLAERIAKAWEDESEHRREIERREQRAYYLDYGREGFCVDLRIGRPRSIRLGGLDGSTVARGRSRGRNNRICRRSFYPSWQAKVTNLAN